MVLGIQPRWPETGYGYIEFPKGVRAGGLEARAGSRSFREKPDARRRKRFLTAGNFYWNAGMFFWQTSVLLDALREFLPKTASLLASLPPFGSRQLRCEHLNAAFPMCENISIDYAVLERATNVVGIPAGDIGWNDVGSWNAVYELQQRDANGNALRADSFGRSEHRQLRRRRGKAGGAAGREGSDRRRHARRAADRRPDAAQEVGDLVKKLEEQRREDLV